MNSSSDDQAVMWVIAVSVALLAVALRKRRWKPSGTSHGTAAWMGEKAMRAAGYFREGGLIVARAFSGALIRLQDYVHVLVVGGTGSGKGVSIIIPNLLHYNRGSIVCFDTKGDLYETKRRAAKGERIIRLAPFTGGQDAYNPLDAIPRDSPKLVDSARSMAEDLVYRAGTEPDPYWNDKSVQIITALLVLVLLTFADGERNLISVQEIISDADLLKAACRELQKLGGVPARLGNQLKALFAKEEE